MPESPRLITNRGMTGANVITELPPCPGDEASSTSSGLSGGAIAGVVLGSVAGVAGERLQAAGFGEAPLGCMGATSAQMPTGTTA